MASKKEMIPWINLATFIIKQAEKDVKKYPHTNIGKDAMWFLKSQWGEYLYDNISMFEKIINEGDEKLKN